MNNFLKFRGLCNSFSATPKSHITFPLAAPFLIKNGNLRFRTHHQCGARVWDDATRCFHFRSFLLAGAQLTGGRPKRPAWKLGSWQVGVLMEIHMLSYLRMWLGRQLLTSIPDSQSATPSLYGFQWKCRWNQDPNESFPPRSFDCGDLGKKLCSEQQSQSRAEIII